MPRGGRYRYTRSSTWLDPDFDDLLPAARLTLRALETGWHSNLAGISLLHPTTLARETGLGPEELEAALGELEKRPRPATSFIVRDDLVVWVRGFLRGDPAREKDPDITNPKHRQAIETILGSLPRTSPTVRKFRDYYKFRGHTLSHRVSQGVSRTLPASPESSRAVEQKSSRTESGERERREPTGGRVPPNPPLAHAGSNNGNGNPEPASRETAKTRPPRDEYRRLLEAALQRGLRGQEAESAALEEMHRLMVRP